MAGTLWWRSLMDDIGFLVLKRERERVVLLVREATEERYALALPGDSINIAFPESKTRRGRVGHGIAQTLLTGNEQVVVVEERVDTDGKPEGRKVGADV